MKRSLALKKERETVLAAAYHIPVPTSRCPNRRRVKYCFQSGSPYLPVVTEIEAAHLCRFRANNNEVIVLKIAQGGMTESSPLCLTSPAASHAACRDLGLAPGSLGVPASGSPRVLGSNSQHPRVTFFKRTYRVKACVVSSLALYSILCGFPSSSLLCCHYTFWCHVRTQLTLLI